MTQMITRARARHLNQQADQQMNQQADQQIDPEIEFMERTYSLFPTYIGNKIDQKVSELQTEFHNFVEETRQRWNNEDNRNNPDYNQMQMDIQTNRDALKVIRDGLINQNL